MKNNHRELTRHERKFIVTVTYNRSGEIFEEEYLLEEIGYEFNQSFAQRLLKANGEPVPYNSKRVDKPISGQITGHAEVEEDSDEDSDIEEEEEEINWLPSWESVDEYSQDEDEDYDY